MFGRRTLTLAALVAAGCAPQDAEVTGNWFVWLGANTSATVAEGELEEALSTATVFECSGRGWDSDSNDWDPAYVGPRTSDDYQDERFIGGACARTESGGYESFCEDLVEEMSEECDGVDALEFHVWQQEDGFYATNGPIAPWRTEALLNSEGDLQLTTHVDLGNGQDFRFHFSIDPHFAPYSCVSDENGNAVVEYDDGANWVEEWSEDEDGYSIYYLNSGAYQISPNDSDTYWYLTSDWNAGYGFSKWAAEEFNSHPTDYGNYNFEFDHFEAPVDREDPDMDVYAAAAADLAASADTWSAELYDVAHASVDDEAAFAHKIEDNIWRPIDIHSSGLDGWMGLQSSWVRIKDGSTIEAGGTVEGDFQIYSDGTESSSRLLVTGSFTIPELREDPWGYGNLEADKRDQYGTPYCGGAAMP